MTSFLRNAFDRLYNAYANPGYAHSFSEDPHASQTNSQLLQRMEGIIQKCLKLPGVERLDMKLPCYEFPDGSTTDSWNKIISLKEELTRSREWIQRLKNEFAQGECLELPHLCHMASLNSLIEIIQSGAVLVSSKATPGAWFSSKPELNYGTYGILLDLRHSPKAEYAYSSDTWTGFQRPFFFKQKKKLHIAGIVVVQLEDANKVRNLLKKTKEELPDHLFVTTKEAYLRTWLLARLCKFLWVDLA